MAGEGEVGHLKQAGAGRGRPTGAGSVRRQPLSAREPRAGVRGAPGGRTARRCPGTAWFRGDAGRGQSSNRVHRPGGFGRAADRVHGRVRCAPRPWPCLRPQPDRDGLARRGAGGAVRPGSNAGDGASGRMPGRGKGRRKDRPGGGRGLRRDGCRHAGPSEQPDGDGEAGAGDARVDGGVLRQGQPCGRGPRPGRQRPGCGRAGVHRDRRPATAGAFRRADPRDHHARGTGAEHHPGLRRRTLLRPGPGSGVHGRTLRTRGLAAARRQRRRRAAA